MAGRRYADVFGDGAVTDACLEAGEGEDDHGDERPRTATARRPLRSPRETRPTPPPDNDFRDTYVFWSRGHLWGSRRDLGTRGRTKRRRTAVRRLVDERRVSDRRQTQQRRRRFETSRGDRRENIFARTLSDPRPPRRKIF